MIWHAYKTAAQAEFRIQEKMIALGARTVVPAQWQWRRVKNARPVPRRRPVIPGYVFAGFNEVPWWALSVVDGLHGVVSFDGRPAIIPDKVIPSIAALEQPLRELSQGPRFRMGQAIKIKRGAFAELAAVVDGFERGKVVAIVHMFGKSARVPVSMEHLEEVEAA